MSNTKIHRKTISDYILPYTNWITPDFSVTYDKQGVTILRKIRCVENWTGGGVANISQNPLFVHQGHWDDNGTPEDSSDDFWVEGDYRLRPGSPCVDAGDSSVIEDLPPRDVYGRPRVRNGRVDIGACEFQAGSSNLPWIDRIRLVENVIEIWWAEVVPAPPGYILEWADSPLSQAWTVLNTTTSHAALDTELQGAGRRFYRVRLAE